jgi:hypothetical protein
MKYEKQAALQLVGAMDNYAAAVVGSARAMANLTCSTTEWQDAKYNEFRNLLADVIGDVQEGCNTVVEYRNHLLGKINELG